MRLHRDAGAGAAADVEVEALAVGRDMRVDVVAGAHREDCLRHPQQISKRLDLGVGAEVSRAVTLDPAHERHARVGFLPRNADVGVAFVVLEPDVVGRLMLAHEGGLKEERVPFGIDRDEIQILDLADERDLLRADLVGALEV